MKSSPGGDSCVLGSDVKGSCGWLVVTAEGEDGERVNEMEGS